MSYLVLARKYRPSDFDSVRGQEHVTRTLKHAIERGKVGHAFLFTGPRGVGKTSVSRILAKALNCQNGPTPSPCGQCTNCLEVAKGTSLAVREIDGASNNGVDNIRELIDSVRSLPAPGSRYKVYIIDEVHMLSLAAFNALLKSLEEPPPHTVFILATTEAHKIPDTVISRCQRHDFRALPFVEVIQALRDISAKEDFKVEDAALRMVARLSEGSMRDAQTLLDRVHAYAGENITAQATSEVLGAVERMVLDRMVRAIVRRDPTETLTELDAAFTRGLDPSLFLREFVNFWRELLLIRFAGDEGALRLGISDDERTLLSECTQELSNRDLQDLVDLVRDGGDKALRSTSPRLAIEALLVRLATREPVADIAALVQGILKRDAAGGSGGATVQTAGTAAKSSSGAARSRYSASRSETAELSSSTDPNNSRDRNRPDVTTSVSVSASAPVDKKPSPEAAKPAVARSEHGALSQSGAVNQSSTGNQHGAPSQSSTPTQPAPTTEHSAISAPSAPTSIAPDRPTPPAQSSSSQSVPSSVATPPTQTVDGTLQWAAFVQHIESGESKFIGGYLRRVSPQLKGPQILILQGPAFSLDSLRREDNKKKLHAALERFTGKQWSLDFQVITAVGGSAKGSLEHEALQSALEVRQQQEERVRKHPSVQVVTEVFQGTEIDQIRSKAVSISKGE